MKKNNEYRDPCKTKRRMLKATKPRLELLRHSLFRVRYSIIMSCRQIVIKVGQHSGLMGGSDLTILRLQLVQSVSIGRNLLLITQGLTAVDQQWQHVRLMIVGPKMCQRLFVFFQVQVADA